MNPNPNPNPSPNPSPNPDQVRGVRIHTRTELGVNHPKHGYIVAALPYIDAVKLILTEP